jgi:flagellar hook-basal body complex protein FliE
MSPSEFPKLYPALPDDAFLAPPAEPAHRSFADALAGAFGDATAALARADDAERAFASGRGGLQEMVLERAQADVSLAIAGAAASRVAQALGTILGMQV